MQQFIPTAAAPPVQFHSFSMLGVAKSVLRSPVSASGMMRCLLRLAALVFLFVSPAGLMAQGAGLVSTTSQLRQTEIDIRAVDRQLDGLVDQTVRKDLAARLVVAQRSADTSVSALRDSLGLVDERIAGLGPVGDGTETADLKRQRASLTAERAALDAAIKRGSLASVEAQQLIDEITRSETEQFNARLSVRSASPLAPSFWTKLLHSVPRDTRRIGVFLNQGGDQIAAHWRGGLPWQAIVGLLAALALWFPAHSGALVLGQRYLIAGAPGHRLRRSAYAVWRVVIGTLAPSLAAAALIQGMRWSGLLPDRWLQIEDPFVLAVGFGGFTAAVLGAILMASKPSWRIAPIEDPLAARLRPLTWMLAGLSGGGILIVAFNTAVGASPSAQVMVQAVLALVHIALAMAFLSLLARARASHVDDEVDDQKVRAGLGAVMLAGWLVTIAAIIALVSGYIALSAFMMELVAWALVLAATLYLLTSTVDDLATGVFVRDSRLGQTMCRAFAVRPATVDQFGVMLSAVLRLVIVVIGLALLFSPFGAGGGIGAMLASLGNMAQGVEISGVSISPGTVIRGIVVLLIGLALARAFMGWLETRYLPATDLDGSSRNSITLVARYVVMALAVIWALASLGVGVERIALLLSALSVGIGFGLQAITQNFVSGLILLAERPIKIGDLIRVGDDEGDVKRISVRSTEIELGDHSTLIVPNSELITKSVLNKTMAGTLGRIQLQFSIPIEADAGQVKEIVLAIFAQEPAVLDVPAPVLFIDSIADGRILFNGFAHVASSRAAYGARSNILTILLQRLRESDISIGTTPQRLELVADPNIANTAAE